jgi:hypothetical protein
MVETSETITEKPTLTTLLIIRATSVRGMTVTVQVNLKVAKALSPLLALLTAD